MNKFIGLMVGASVLAIAGTANALVFDQNVTPEIIFGSGNTNGSFTVDRAGGVELGLRAKIPFAGTLHSGGDGTYTYNLGEANPRWNFDWTVNTDFDSGSPTGAKINDFTYLLGIDFDSGVGTDFLTFDPITPTSSSFFLDHSIGDNSTPNGGGTEATNGTEYANLIANNNVLQQSWRHAFFPIHPTLTYNPAIPGTYDIFLAAFDGGVEIARTEIQVNIVPEPASLALFGLAVLGLGAVRRRRRAA